MKFASDKSRTTNLVVIDVWIYYLWKVYSRMDVHDIFLCDIDRDRCCMFSQPEYERSRLSGGRRTAGMGRQYSRPEEQTPEWFTEGPSSQNETIDLHGFEKPAEDTEKQNKRKEQEKLLGKACKILACMAREGIGAFTCIFCDGLLYQYFLNDKTF